MFQTLSKSDVIPRYAAAERAIRAAVERGRLAPGDRLPGQRALAEQLGIAHMTLRRAVDHLVEEGVLERRPGSGTFVRRGIGAPNLCLLAFNVRSIQETLVRHTLEAISDAVRATGGREVRGLVLAQPLPAPAQVLAELRAMKVGAVGVVGFRNPEARFVTAVAEQIPCVLFYKGMPGVALPCAKANPPEAARLIVDYFVQRGRRRIGMLMVDTRHEMDNELSYAVQAELGRHGLPVDKRFWFEWVEDSPVGRGRVEDVRWHWLKERIEAKHRPDALIFISSSELAELAQFMEARGERLGRELDVVVVASLPSRRRARWPQLSWNSDAAAAAGAGMLLDIVEGRAAEASAPAVASAPELILPDDPQWQAITGAFCTRQGAEQTSD